MKYIYLLFIAVMLSPHLRAETPVERIYLQTDKSFYLAGETVCLKAYSVNAGLQPQSLSKVVYTELTGSSNNRVQIKLKLQDGTGSGFMQLPPTLPSGVYKLSAYTRYMQNEGEEVFFTKMIGVFNAYSASPDDRIELVADSLPLRAQETNTNDKYIALGQSAYSRQEKATLTLKNLPANAHLAISIFRDDSVHIGSFSSIREWAEQTKKPGQRPMAPLIMPEYAGPILEGQLVSMETNQPITSLAENITTNLAIPGNQIRLYGGKTTPDGKVTFETAGMDNVKEIVLLAENKTNDTCRIDLLSPFVTLHASPTPPLVLQKRQKDLLLTHSLSTQTASLANTYTDTVRIAPDTIYYLTPYRVYNLDEYVRFSTLQQTVKEYVQSLQIRKINDMLRFSVLKQELKQYNDGSTLVLLDGIPVFNHQDMIDYNSYLLKRIEIYSNTYVFGGQTYEAIVAFYTERNNFPEFRLKKNAQLLNFQEIQATTTVFAGHEKASTANLPDFRHTLYWNPDVQNKEKETVNLSFYTSGLPGSYIINIEGITDNGQIICSSGKFIVNE